MGNDSSPMRSVNFSFFLTPVLSFWRAGGIIESRRGRLLHSLGSRPPQSWPLHPCGQLTQDLSAVLLSPPTPKRALVGPRTPPRPLDPRILPPACAILARGGHGSALEVFSRKAAGAQSARGG